MKKTKIICSIGPASVNPEILKQMVDNGMDVARINFSHASIAERKTVVESVKKVREITGKQIAILYDTKGPDFRTGNLENGTINLIVGNTIRIVREDVLGNEARITVNYQERLSEINIGTIILLEDGLMKLEVISKETDGITCKIVSGGTLGERKGIAVPGVKFNTPFLSEQDKEDIIYACNNDADFLALSFVETKEDIMQVGEILKAQNREDIRIISKIESGRAITNLNEIVEHSNGIMIARGDLGVELPLEQIPVIQKKIITKCRRENKAVIVATEMLASMYENSRPTRAEVTDIANAVLEGTDAVMLSGETTVGKHPVEAVKYMADICMNAENYYEYNKDFRSQVEHNITDTLAKCVITSSAYLNAKVIVANTTHGGSAREISNLKPKSLILANVPNEKVARSLALNWGVYTNVTNISGVVDEIIKNSLEAATRFMPLVKEDVIIITGGFHDKEELKISNFLKIETI